MNNNFRFLHTPYTKLRLFFSIFAGICFCLLFESAIGRTIPEKNRSSSSVTVITEAEVTVKNSISNQPLPYKITNLSPGEEFSVSFSVIPQNYDALYVKTVYAPFRLYANGSLLYSYGEEGSYPSFFSDPPTNVAAIDLPVSDTGKPIAVTIVYKAPTARNNMIIAAPLVGSNSAIINDLIRKLGVQLLFSFVLIFIGILLILMTLLLIQIESGRASLLWLGLFSLSTGIWTFSENNLTVFIAGNPSLLYLLSFSGLMFVTIPLYHFAMEILTLKEDRILQSLCLFQEFAFLAALFLQLSGFMPFSKSVSFFHFLLPFSCVFLAAYVLYLRVRNHNPWAQKFFLPFLVIAVSSLMEILNYKIRLITNLSSIFELGIFVFIILAEILAGKFVREAFILKQDNMLLRSNLDLLEKQAEFQQERVRLLLKNDELVKRQRHDIKHQYALLTSLYNQKDFSALGKYLQELSSGIPGDQTKVYCENTAVNAIVSYYCAEASLAETDLSIQLDIPENLSGISDQSLCVIFGNLLENAAEACLDMKKSDGKPFIHLIAQNMKGSLYIAMSNSFNGILRYHNGKLLSHKRSESGIGLLSICSIAESSGGHADFHADGKIFLSDVVIRLEE